MLLGLNGCKNIAYNIGKTIEISRLKYLGIPKDFYNLAFKFLKKLTFELQMISLGGTMILIPGGAEALSDRVKAPSFFFTVPIAIKKVNRRLKEAQSEIDFLVGLTEALVAEHQSDYLTTRQFAFLVELAPKTITNYVRDGKIKTVTRTKNGYLIHKSELENYLDDYAIS